MEKLTRGVRNNNPGNLRVSNVRWLGKIAPSRKKDKEFEEFESVQWGMRAAVVNLNTMVCRTAGRTTVSSAIEAWAPPKENDTKNYIRLVVEKIRKVNPMVEDGTELTDLGLNEMVAMILEIFRIESDYVPDHKVLSKIVCENMIHLRRERDENNCKK